MTGREPPSANDPIPPDAILNEYSSVRGGGQLEPPWLLTASTSNGIEGARPKDFAVLERQQTSESGQKRPILDQLGQNSVHSLEEAHAAVARALCAALQRWDAGCEARDLRVHLVRLLALLEATGL